MHKICSLNPNSAMVCYWYFCPPFSSIQWWMKMSAYYIARLKNMVRWDFFFEPVYHSFVEFGPNMPSDLKMACTKTRARRYIRPIQACYFRITSCYVIFYFFQQLRAIFSARRLVVRIWDSQCMES